MGFKYVFVPADANYPMEELEYKESIDSLENDTFRPFIEKYFASLGQSADRGVLLKQLQERTGVDIKGQVDKGEMAAEAADKLLATTSVEIFPVQLPTKQVDFEGISVYCDDKGIAKDLMVNERMSGIVQAAGYPGQQFRGDCFIGRIYDDTEDEWRRIDFTKQDCSTDAAWVSSTKAQRANRSVGDMQNLAGKLGANNPAHITPSMLEASAPTGETEQYKWTQASDEVEITFKREGIQKEDKKFVKVNFARQKLKVELKGELLIDASLFGATQPDESTWTLSDGVLQVLEHIPAESELTAVDNLGMHARRALVLSWAPPGVAGSGHVNQRTPADVQEIVERTTGLILNLTLTAEAQKRAQIDWIAQSVSIFLRQDA